MSTTSQSPATVFIVDDDRQVRTALRRLFQAIGLPSEEFESAEAFLAAHHDRPGCLVLDLRMPGSNGLELQRRLAEAAVRIPIIFLTAHADVAFTVEAMKAGALEVFTKPVDEQPLIEAVRRAIELDAAARERAADAVKVSALGESLTKREHEVMLLVVSGLPNKLIADRLGTSEKTVKVHRARVMHKMHAQSLPDLVRMADRLSVNRPRD